MTTQELIHAACGKADEITTCGSCEGVWCDRCDPAHGPLCPWCHGMGYSTAAITAPRHTRPNHQPDNGGHPVQEAHPDDVGVTVVYGGHYWGKGKTLEEAKRNFRRFGGRLGYGYAILTFDEHTEFQGFDGLGRYSWRATNGDNAHDHAPTEKIIKPRGGKR